MVRKFPEKGSETVEFPKNEPLNRTFLKFRKESQIKWKFPVRNFGKFRYTLQGCSVLYCSIRHWKFLVMQTGVYHRMESAQDGSIYVIDFNVWE